MPTLLDTAEFALAKTTLDETLQRIEKARQDRLESLRRERAINQASLENAKRGVREFPIDIARQDAEIARLEATTGADILREAMSALKAECWGPPGEVVEVQSPKPHACPRCDEGMREIELTKNVYVKPDGIRDECWGSGERRTATIIHASSEGVLVGVPMRSDGSHPWYLEASQYRFLHPDVPPPSEWCDGSGKGGAE